MGYIGALNTSSLNHSQVNVANTGFINNFNGKTINAETNVFNAGFINNGSFYDSMDKTNITNAGLINQLNLTSGHHGEFNVNNLYGAIGQLNANINHSSVFNLLT